jgi:phosphinothricin acetyltransferase
MDNEIHITPLAAEEWPAVRAIYAAGIATGQATFETDVPDWPAWDAARLPCCRLAARRGAALVGWATLGPVSSRPVYRGVAEVSVYVATAARGQGVGRHGLWRDTLLLERRSGRAGS